jgi:hypothetical protein
MEWRERLHELNQSYVLVYAIEPRQTNAFDRDTFEEWFQSTVGFVCYNADADPVFVVFPDGIIREYECVSDDETITQFLTNCEDDSLTSVVVTLVRDDNEVIQLGFHQAAAIVIRLK